jgi:hypothetical protein
MVADLPNEKLQIFAKRVPAEEGVSPRDVSNGEHAPAFSASIRASALLASLDEAYNPMSLLKLSSKSLQALCYKLILPSSEKPAYGAAAYLPQTESFAIEQLGRLIMEAHESEQGKAESGSNAGEGGQSKSPAKGKRPRAVKTFVNGFSASEEKFLRDALQHEKCVYGPPEERWQAVEKLKKAIESVVQSIHKRMKEYTEKRYEGVSVNTSWKRDTKAPQPEGGGLSYHAGISMGVHAPERKSGRPATKGRKSPRRSKNTSGFLNQFDQARGYRDFLLNLLKVS